MGKFVVGLVGLFCVCFSSVSWAADQKEIVIGLSLCSAIEQRWLKEKDMLVEAATAKGIKVIDVYAENDADKQVKQCADLISVNKVNVLVVVAQDADKAAAIVENAHKAGVKVLAYDRMIKNADLDFYLSFDNVKVGEFEALGVTKAAPKGNYAYIGGSPTDNNAHLVKKGSMSILQPLIDKGDIKIVSDSFTQDWRSDLAYEQMVKVLEANKNDIQGVVCANDGTAAGTIQALTAAGLAGKVAVSGQDAELAACQRIMAGTQTLSVYKSSPIMTEKGIEIAEKLANGEAPESNQVVNNGKIDVKSFLLEPIMVTKDNMEATVVADEVYSLEDVSKKPAA